MEAYNLVSFAGIFGLIGVAWIFSKDRRQVNFRLVGFGVALQLLFGLVVFVLPVGRDFFWWLNSWVVKALGAATEGSTFVFGALAISPGNQGSLGFFLAFQVFPAIIFFSALVAVLYYIHFMPWLIKRFAWVFSKSMQISGAEAVSAASNIFVGVESALTIKPHLPKMTQSELCTVLTAGMATVASNVLAFYVFTLHEVFPAIAGHLISASIISAPAAVVFSKVLLPETENPQTLGVAIDPHYEREANLFDAIIVGAQNGVTLVVGVVGLLIAVLGLVGLLNMAIGGVGDWINQGVGWNFEWSLKSLLGLIFYPFTLIIGVPIQDAWKISQIIGERIVMTEVVSYQDLAMLAKGQTLSPRTLVITAYALCGFAHVASMSIFVGGVAAIAPERRTDLARLGARALAAATLACLMTGAIAGTFFTGTNTILGG